MAAEKCLRVVIGGSGTPVRRGLALAASIPVPHSREPDGREGTDSPPAKVNRRPQKNRLRRIEQRQAMALR